MIRKAYCVILLAYMVSYLPLGAQYRSQVWCSDNGDGTYTNPVIYADYSDPDLCALGQDYYLTASSFNCMPGLPILHSRDLVNWQIVGHALHRQFPDSIKPQHGCGVWAPSIRYHAGEFYIYWGDPDRGVMMVHSTKAEGPWSEPCCVVPGKGMIDTCPLWDDDGRCYLVNGWANSRAGFNSVLTVRQLNSTGTSAIGNPVIVFDGGQRNLTTEGPKFYKRDGWYWILCPAGGVAHGWQLAMRSKNPYGPYEWRRVLWQGHTAVNGPHQGGWVHTEYGEDWFMHFQDCGPYGRVVWLEPVDWSSGWPMMGRHGEPYITHHKPKAAPTIINNPQESDEFNQPALGFQWQWQADYDQYFGMPTANGYFRLFTFRMARLGAEHNWWNVPNMLLQKLPAKRFMATAKLRLAAKQQGQCGGVIMMGRGYSALVMARQGDSFELRLLNCDRADAGQVPQCKVLEHFAPTDSDRIDYHPAIYMELFLRMQVCDGQLSWAYSIDGKHYRPIEQHFSLREGKWIGAKMGLVATDTNSSGDLGWIDVDWWRVEPITK